MIIRGFDSIRSPGVKSYFLSYPIVRGQSQRTNTGAALHLQQESSEALLQKAVLYARM